MKRWIVFVLVLAMLLGMAACAKKPPTAPSLSDKLNNLPTVQQPEKEPEQKPEEEPEQPKEEPRGETKEEPKEEEPDAPPADRVADFTAYDGMYREKETGPDGEITYLAVKGFDEFLLLEYFVEYEGSTFTFDAEEFWPNEPGIDGSRDVQVGKSQMFSLMTMGDEYSDLPMERRIALTESGLYLQDESGEKRYFVRDEEYGGYHSTEEELMDVLQSIHETEVLDSIAGTWEFWDGWYSVNITLDEDGSFHHLSKERGKPVRVANGAWGVDPKTNNLEIVAEVAGEGQMPCMASLIFSVDEYDNLCLLDPDQSLIKTLGNSYSFWWNEGLPQVNMTQKEALGYVGDAYDLWGAYTDQYGSDYNYAYKLPRILGWSDEATDLNDEILNRFEPIIEEELAAMEHSEFLSTEAVQYKIYRHEDILMIHVYTFTYMMNEVHAVYYWNTETNTRTDSRALLKQLGISEKEFLDAVRADAEACFKDYCSGVPEEDREAYGYYEFLEWTVSDEAVNLDLPMFVNEAGELCVYARIGSLAGPSEFWEPIYPFSDFSEGAVG